MGARGESLRRPRGVRVEHLNPARACLTAILVLGAVITGLLNTGFARIDPSVVQECREGGDFIRNAALARDHGMPRDDFLGRMRDDFVVVRAFPPALRWFVHSPADERFLDSQTEQVFDAPEAPDQHRAAFVARCLQRAPQLSQ